MKYVVFRSGGKQYKASENDVLEVDKLPFNKDQEVELNDVLLMVWDNKTKIGTPNLKDVKVKVKVLDQVKGDKIRVSKFKAKSRYRRVIGFRPLLTRIQVQKIELAGTAK